MTPKQYKQMMDYLTRKGIKKPFTPASAIERPKKVLEIEAFQDFNKRNPVNKADGGRIGFYKGKLVTKGPRKGQYNVAVTEGGKTVQKYFPNEKLMNEFLQTKYTTTPIDDPQRLKDIKKYFKDYKKINKVFPTQKETMRHFKNLTGMELTKSIKIAAKEANIELPSGYGKNLKIKIDEDIKKLLNRKSIIDTLDAGKFPTESQIQTILNSNRTAAATRQVDLANYLAGNEKPQLKSNLKVPTKYKNIATTAIKDLSLIKDEGQFGPRKVKTRAYNEKRLAKILGIDSFELLRKNISNKIVNLIPELKSVIGIDEIGGITAGARTDSPYTIFGQVLGKDFNQYRKSTGIDKSKSLLEKKLITLPKNDPQRLIELEKYNKKVDNFEQMANKNNPAKKVKGMKLSFEPPSKAIKNKKVYNQYKDLFDAHYKKYGYSFEVDKDTDSLPDILKKLDNKPFQNKIKSNFKSLIGKGGKLGVGVGLATLAGTGFALADEAQAADGAQTPGFTTGEKIAAGAAAGTVGTKPGRKLLGKVFRTLGTRAAGSLFAADQIRSNIQKGENIADAVVDPLVGLELSFPGLFKENVAKITKNPILQRALNLGRFARFTTPVGAALGIAGLGVDYGKFVKRELERKAADPEAYRAEQEEQMGVSAAEGGLIGDKSGPPPESGPTPHGLPAAFKRVKKG